MTSRAQVLTNRRSLAHREVCQRMAHDLGLRVERFPRRDGGDVYALWPLDGCEWELDDPPTASTWPDLRDLLKAIHTNLSRRAA